MIEFDFETWAAEAIVALRSGIHLRRPSNYQSLFKYISLNSDVSWDYLHKTLHEAELVGAAASSLNDPFELNPYVFDDLQSSIIAEAVRHTDSAFLDDREPTPLSEVFPDPEPFRLQARLYLQQVLDRYRIIAFCERVDSSLLWSHYANSYQGACLHFLAKGFRWHSHYTLGHVSYSKYRPAYPLSLALALYSQRGARADQDGPARPWIPARATPLQRAESNKILFFTKADDWAYEAEIKLVYDQEQDPVVRFNKDSLVSIITGPRFTDENHQRLDTVLKGSLYENIPIRKARLSKTTFTVEIGE
jgi:hypothetical protein